ncbi:MAG: hypothetical protein AAF585_04185 [Verrucomicrobiota bacterium]
MKSTFYTSLIGLLAFGAALAQEEKQQLPKPRMFSEVGSAIQYAKGNEQLILFALIDRADHSQAVVKMLNDNTLSLQQKEFVIVTCDSSRSSNVTLFKDRFQQDTSKAPVVVVTNSGGEMLGAKGGQSAFNDYIKIIHESLVKAGMREDSSKAPLLAADLGNELVSGGSKIFQMTMDDIKMKNVLLSEFRDWTLKDGETFNAAVVKGEGEFGVFRMEDGSDREVAFGDFSPEDIEFLKTVLLSEDPNAEKEE